MIDQEVYVLSVYDKSDIENLTEKELKKLMDALKPIAKKKTTLEREGKEKTSQNKRKT